MESIFNLDTPAVLVDYDRLQSNLEAMSALCASGGKRLRPHIKTHKCIEIARMQLAAGATGLTVAKLGEAEVLVDAGFDDLFVANQIVGPLKIDRLLALPEHARVQVGLDDAEVATQLDIAAQKRGRRIPVRIEIDTGNGRAGTRTLEQTLRLARIVSECEGLDFAGIFTHEGHLYLAKSADERRVEAGRVIEALMMAVSELDRQRTPAAEVSVGSTPGASDMATLTGPTELRPGVYVFNDRIQVALGVPEERCALSVIATVISIRSDGVMIIDAGSKTLAGDRFALDQSCGAVMEHPEIAFFAASEEHGHLRVPGHHGVKVGDRLRILPNHACTCVNMHDRLYIHRGEEVVDRWAVAARGKVT